MSPLLSFILFQHYDVSLRWVFKYVIVARPWKLIVLFTQQHTAVSHAVPVFSSLFIFGEGQLTPTVNSFYIHCKIHAVAAGVHFSLLLTLRCVSLNSVGLHYCSLLPCKGCVGCACSLIIIIHHSSVEWCQTLVLIFFTVAGLESQSLYGRCFNCYSKVEQRFCQTNCCCLLCAIQQCSGRDSDAVFRVGFRSSADCLLSRVGHVLCNQLWNVFSSLSASLSQFLLHLEFSVPLSVCFAHISLF